MKVLLDTNVVLDAIANREPFMIDAQKIMNLILDNKLEGYITANSITDIYYIARKHLSKNDLHKTLHSLFKIFDIIDVFGADCRKALDFPLVDYEDALLAVCGERAFVDYIITRDEEFLRQTKIPVISPSDFVKKALNAI
jgi:predicted nucleic acid-binding protein